jgi:hypothetical protein
MGGSGRFKIREAGGFTGNPLPPGLSNAHFPGNHAYNTPDETKGFTRLPKVSKPHNSRAMGGGFTDNPPTPMPGGLARPGTQMGEGVGC